MKKSGAVYSRFAAILAVLMLGVQTFGQQQPIPICYHYSWRDGRTKYYHGPEEMKDDPRVNFGYRCFADGRPGTGHTPYEITFDIRFATGSRLIFNEDVPHRVTILHGGAVMVSSRKREWKLIVVADGRKIIFDRLKPDSGSKRGAKHFEQFTYIPVELPRFKRIMNSRKVTMQLGPFSWRLDEKELATMRTMIERTQSGPQVDCPFASSTPK